MNNIDIKLKAKEYLGLNESEDILSSDMAQNVNLFLEKINDLTDNQIVSILKKNPKLSVSTHSKTKLHALHYACLTNNVNKLSLIIKCALSEGLSELPNLTKPYKVVEENDGLMSFCVQLNLDKSLAYLMTLLKSPEEQNITRFVSLAIFRNADSVLNFLSKCLDEKEFQKTLLETINGVFRNKDDRTLYVKNLFFKDYLDLNFNNFDKFKINPEFKLENGVSYLSLFTSALYSTPSNMVKGLYFDSDKEKIQFNQGMKKIKRMISFLALECNISWNEKDNLDSSPKDYWERFLISNFSKDTDVYDDLNEFGAMIYKKQIESHMPEKEVKKEIRIKI